MPFADRRSILQQLSVCLASLAGCIGSISTEQPSGPLTPDDFRFEVTILQSFTRDHPARLRITFTNTSGTKLQGGGGRKHLLPFVAPNYLSTSAKTADSRRLFLYPDGAEFGIAASIASNPDDVTNWLPAEPTDGCWKLTRVPQVFAFTPVYYTIELQPGETRSHEYLLYFVGGCGPGTFSFESTITILKGSGETPSSYDLKFGFSVTTAAEDLSVSRSTPTIIPK